MPITQFTTRSDVGPAREPTPAEIETLKQKLAEKRAAEGDDGQFNDAENEEGLFAGGEYDEEDAEADRIYAAVEAKMDERRKTWR